MQEIKCTTKAIAKTFITELECEFPLFAFKSPLTSTNKKGKVAKAKAQVPKVKAVTIICVAEFPKLSFNFSSLSQKECKAPLSFCIFQIILQSF